MEYQNKIIRSRAPLRLGLAGGGTDLPSYSKKYGGAVLNVTINMYAHCTIEVLNNGSEIIFEALDLGERITHKLSKEVSINNRLKLHSGVYNRIIKDYNNNIPLSLKVSTYADSPIGSGLGTSSSLVVAMVKAYVELLRLPLGEYDVAKLAYDIERNDLELAGGMQDQYAATFGGFNFIEIDKNLNVVVNPLRVRNWIKNEIEESLLLFFTGQSRESAKIIKEQESQTKNNSESNLVAMHELKESAFRMKEHILKGDIRLIAEELNIGWEAKKKTSTAITNSNLDAIYKAALNAGALAGKVSGAGGGGFMMFIVEPRKKNDVKKALSEFNGHVRDIDIIESGTKGWFI